MWMRLTLVVRRQRWLDWFLLTTLLSSVTPRYIAFFLSQVAHKWTETLPSLDFLFSVPVRYARTMHSWKEAMVSVTTNTQFVLLATKHLLSRQQGYWIACAPPEVTSLRTLSSLLNTYEFFYRFLTSGWSARSVLHYLIKCKVRLYIK